MDSCILCTKGFNNLSELELGQLLYFHYPYSVHSRSALLHDHSSECELKLTTSYCIVTKS